MGVAMIAGFKFHHFSCLGCQDVSVSWGRAKGCSIRLRSLVGPRVKLGQNAAACPRRPCASHLLALPHHSPLPTGLHYKTSKFRLTCIRPTSKDYGVALIRHKLIELKIHDTAKSQFAISVVFVLFHALSFTILFATFCDFGLAALAILVTRWPPLPCT